MPSYTYQDNTICDAQPNGSWCNFTRVLFLHGANENLTKVFQVQSLCASNWCLPPSNAACAGKKMGDFCEYNTVYYMLDQADPKESGSLTTNDYIDCYATSVSSSEQGQQAILKFTNGKCEQGIVGLTCARCGGYEKTLVSKDNPLFQQLVMNPSFANRTEAMNNTEQKWNVNATIDKDDDNITYSTEILTNMSKKLSFSLWTIIGLASFATLFSSSCYSQ
jgi:hypothetical protein